MSIYAAAAVMSIYNCVKYTDFAIWKIIFSSANLDEHISFLECIQNGISETMCLINDTASNVKMIDNLILT